MPKHTAREAYSPSQTDVYVLLDVEYTTRISDERGNAQEEVSTASTILKVLSIMPRTDTL